MTIFINFEETPEVQEEPAERALADRHLDEPVRERGQRERRGCD
jgi:hypothetical protein